MQDFLKIFKERAAAKCITAEDMFNRAVLIAMTIKTNAPKDLIAKGILSKTFTPLKNTARIVGDRTPFQAIDRCRPFANNYDLREVNYYNEVFFNKDAANSRGIRSIFGVPLNQIFDSVAELQEFNMIAQAIKETDFPRPKYVYIFVDEKLTPEQVAVQAAHATLVVGNKSEKIDDVEKIPFVLLSVPSVYQVMKKLELFGYRKDRHFIYFIEGTSDKDSVMTSLATFPVAESKRRHFADYPLYRAEKKSAA